MRKFFLVSLSVMAVSVALVAFAGDLPENITIDQCATKKAPVEFSHKAHFEYATCVDCHHTSEGLTLENAAEMEVATCGSCHIEPEKAETPKCSDKTKKGNPYHINCIGCHKEIKAEKADTTAPTSCKACHPKVAK
jgi:nitrate/TMAO reductase-like tetraheme cytochrome c subunit